MYIDWGERIIYIDRDDLTLVQSSPTYIYNLDLNWFRLQLKDLEDSEDGMCFPMTHNHNTEVVLSGLTYARVIEIINGYTITFEDGQYAVNLVGANSNVGDMVNVNQVSVRTSNSAGLIVKAIGSGLSTEEHDQLMILPSSIDIKNDVNDIFFTDNTIELSNIPSVSTSIGKMIQFLYQYFRNKRTVSNTQEKMYKEDGSLVGTSTLSDDGSTFTRGKIE